MRKTYAVKLKGLATRWFEAENHSKARYMAYKQYRNAGYDVTFKEFLDMLEFCKRSIRKHW